MSATQDESATLQDMSATQDESATLQMFTHDGTIEVARIQAHSELVILLLVNHKTVYPGSGLCTFLNDSQLLHSLKLFFKRLAKGHRNPTGRVDNRAASGSV